MQILLIVAIVSTLLLAEGGLARPVAEPAVHLLLAVIGMASVPLSAAAVSSVFSRQFLASSDARRTLRWYRGLRRLHLVLWLAVGVGIAHSLGWPRIVRFNWRLDGVPLVEDLLILAPVVLPLVLSWAAFYRVDRVLSSRGAIAGGESEQAFASLSRYVAAHIRHYLGILLVPILCLLAIQDVVGWWRPSGLREETVVGVLIVAMLLILVFFPVLPRRIWRTRRLASGELRTRLETMARRNGMRVSEILVWDTDSMVVNAAVTGLSPWLRYVFLSDGLLRLLDEDEVATVFAHELGHVRHGHVWLRAAAMFVPFGAAVATMHAIPDVIERARAWIEAGGFDETMIMGLAGLAAIIIYVLTVFALFSRSLEYEADLSVREQFPPGVGGPVFCSALERLGMAQGSRLARSWQHASIADRVKFLESVEHEPKIGLRYRRRIRLVGGIVIGLALSPLISLLLYSFLLS